MLLKPIPMPSNQMATLCLSRRIGRVTAFCLSRKKQLVCRRRRRMVTPRLSRRRGTAFLERQERRGWANTREDDHHLPLQNLGSGWPPLAYLEERRGEQRREEYERGWSPPTSLEKERGWPSLASGRRQWMATPCEKRRGEEERGWPPLAFLESEGRMASPLLSRQKGRRKEKGITKERIVTP